MLLERRQPKRKEMGATRLGHALARRASAENRRGVLALPLALLEHCLSWLNWQSHLHVAHTCRCLQGAATTSSLGSPPSITIGGWCLEHYLSERSLRCSTQARSCGRDAHLWRTHPQQLTLLFPLSAHHLESVSRMQSLRCLHVVLCSSVTSLSALQTLTHLHTLRLARGWNYDQDTSFDLATCTPRLKSLHTELFVVCSSQMPAQASRLPPSLTHLCVCDTTRATALSEKEWHAMCSLPLVSLRVAYKMPYGMLHHLCLLRSTLRHLELSGVECEEDDEATTRCWQDAKLPRVLSTLRLKSLTLGDLSQSKAVSERMWDYLSSDSLSLSHLEQLHVAESASLRDLLRILAARQASVASFGSTLTSFSWTGPHATIHCLKTEAAAKTSAKQHPLSASHFVSRDSRALHTLDISNFTFVGCGASLPALLCAALGTSVRTLVWQFVFATAEQKASLLPAALSAGLHELDVTGRRIDVREVRRLCPQLRRLGAPLCTPTELKQLVPAQGEDGALVHLSHLDLASCTHALSSQYHTEWRDSPVLVESAFLEVLWTLARLPALEHLMHLACITSATRSDMSRRLREALPRLRMRCGDAFYYYGRRSCEHTPDFVV